MNLGDAGAVGTIVIGLGIIGQVLLIWVQLTRKSQVREITPSPLEVREAASFAPREHHHPNALTKDDFRELQQQQNSGVVSKFEAVQRQLDSLTTRIEATLARHSTEAEERANRIHARIDPVVVAANTAASKLQDHLDAHRNGRT